MDLRIEKLVFNSVLNFRRVTYFGLCLLETQVCTNHKNDNKDKNTKKVIKLLDVSHFCDGTIIGCEHRVETPILLFQSQEFKFSRTLY